MTKIKTNEIPGRAKDLFIKLYCEKKGGETRVNLHNAAQSWLSLSHKKKQDFYETVSIKSVIKNAQLIIQTEPFLKSKLPLIARKNCQTPTESEKPNNEDNSELSSTENIMHHETIIECDSHSNSFAQEKHVYDKQQATSTEDIDSTIPERAESEKPKNEDNSELSSTENMHHETNMECDSHSNSFAQEKHVYDMQPATSAKYIDSTIHERAESEKLNNEDNSELSSTENMHHETIMECDSHSNSFAQKKHVYDIQPVTSAQDIDSTVHERAKESESQPVSNNTQICDAVTQQNSYMNIIDPDEDTHSEDELINKNYKEKEPLQEPVLPVAKSGRDLFDLLKARNGTTATYESLTQSEKYFYGKAALNLKKQYVQKYKEYLESLTSRQLFDYYRNVFF